MAMRLWCGISGHGYGHFSQLSPILRQLRAWQPDLVLRMVGNIPRALITTHQVGAFEHDPLPRDVGLIQQGAMQVDLAATRAALRRIHGEWPAAVAREEAALAAWQPDLVLANVPYLTLLAASRLGIPTVAVASLTWDRVVAAYFGEQDPEMAMWLGQMREAYAHAHLALLPTPALPSPPFPNQQPIPPITSAGRRDPRRLRQELGLAADDPRPVVFVSFGGIPTDFPGLSALARERHILWLTNFPAPMPGDNLFTFDQLGWWHADVTASVDALVGKPGYGMAVEAAANGLPFLYRRRGTFPDEEVICPWLHRHTRAMLLNEEDFWQGCWAPAMEALWAQPAPPRPAVHGALVAARLILDMLEPAAALSGAAAQEDGSARIT